MLTLSTWKSVWESDKLRAALTFPSNTGTVCPDPFLLFPTSFCSDLQQEKGALGGAHHRDCHKHLSREEMQRGWVGPWGFLNWLFWGKKSGFYPSAFPMGFGQHPSPQGSQQPWFPQDIKNHEKVPWPKLQHFCTRIMSWFTPISHICAVHTSTLLHFFQKLKYHNYTVFIISWILPPTVFF